MLKFIKLVFFTLLLCGAFSVNAQQLKSKKQLRVDNLVSQAQKAIEENRFSDAKELGTDAQFLAEDINYQKGNADALLCIANVFRIKREFAQALDYALRAMQIIEGLNGDNRESLLKVYSEISFLYQEWGLTEKTISFQLKALSIAHSLGDKTRANNFNYLIAISYLKIGEKDKALVFFNKCKDFHLNQKDFNQYVSILYRISNIYSSKNDNKSALEVNLEILKVKEENGEKDTFINLNDIGVHYQKLGDGKKAIEYFKRAVEVNKSLGKPESANISLYKNIGSIYQRRRNPDEAMRYYRKVFDIVKKNNDTKGLASAHHSIGLVLSSQGRTREAEEELLKAINISKSLGDTKQLERTYDVLTKIYERAGRNLKAVEAYKDLLKVTKEILNQELDRQKAQTRRLMSAEKKERELDELKSEQELQSARQERLELELIKKAQAFELLKQKEEINNMSFQLEVEEKRKIEDQLYLAEQELLQRVQEEELSKVMEEKKYQELLNKRQADQIEKAQREKNLLSLMKKTEEERNKILQEQNEAKEKMNIIAAVIIGIIFIFLIVAIVLVRKNITKNKRLKSQNTEITQQKEEIEQQRDQVSKAKTQAERAFNNIQVISEFGQEITSKLDIKQIVSQAYDYVGQITDADVFGVGLFREDRDCLEYITFIDKGVPKKRVVIPMSSRDSMGVLAVKSQEEIVVSNMDVEYKDYLASFPILHTDEVTQSVIYLPFNIEQTLGVVTIQNYNKRAFEQKDVNLLRSFASYISIALSNANAYSQLNAKNQHITDSIRYAETIQKAILPTKEYIESTGYEIFSLFKPKDIVSGDYYWFTHLKGDDIDRTGVSDPFTDSMIFLAVADCTGHGVPGGFMSMIGNTLLNEIVVQKNIYDAGEILNELHIGIQKALQQDNETSTNDDGMDVCLLVLERGGGVVERVTFAGAKRSLYYIGPEDNEVQIQKGDNLAIGGLRRKKKDKRFESKEVHVEKGTVIYLTSDGLVDQNDINREKFGTMRLLELLQNNKSKSMEMQREIIERELLAHQGKAEQRDDISMIGIKL
ncbi:tetratricopeptide repeat protein [Sediminitomix flava]|uniref:Serine phosphatase RsbU (Regulator of sigma subunit) n=1 Tax=Sediminitomix flava TaxID=379075 RepID=A0A316A405_SEDFL|nr:tetratricopeptide repeat protein [Sediminitomix flava]PWJ44467.1 serine phosphatase RsbU (regulator of sigma subunit) [Sediminitomix flava]